MERPSINSLRFAMVREVCRHCWFSVWLTALSTRRYLSYGFLASVGDQLDSRPVYHADWGYIPIVNRRIGRLPVDVPDLATQTAIADVLGALDDKIAANEQVRHRAGLPRRSHG